MAQTAKFSSSPMSLTAKGKKWRFPEPLTLDERLLALVGNSHILATLLAKRGIKSEDEAKAFLDPKLYQATRPMELPDVDKALVRINQAIELKEHITVYGDYDVDGVTGTSVLFSVLKELGASVDFYIPNRVQEGYGLNLKAISVLASKHRTKLIITCDCGVSNFAEINFARSLGVDTLILDHHSLPEMLPPAVGIVHPKLLSSEHPLYHLPGVGVAYKVCEAILIDRGLPEKIEALLDFVTLGMIADLVPLVAENRYLVQIGLPCLINSKRPGIQALLAQVKKSDDTDLVGFGLAPRINAVGRLADAKVAVELLTTEDEQVAEALSNQLKNENIKRQEICEKIFFEAEQMISTGINLEHDRAIVIYKEGWHHGVVGIVASRLVEKYGRPVFIAELDKGENLVKGSARSIDGVDLYAVLKENEQLLLKWGGHKMAAGFAVAGDKADTLCRALVSSCNRALEGQPPYQVLDIDLTVDEADVSLDLTRLLFKLSPFGMGNKKPLICVQRLTCESVRILGKEGKHHRIMLGNAESKTTFESVMWNSRGNIPAPGECVDIVFTPESNSFNGRERLQLVLADWRPHAQDSGYANDASGKQALSIASLDASGAEPAIATASIDRIPTSSLVRSISKSASVHKIWKDLRDYTDTHAIIIKAMDKFGDRLSIFAEGAVNGNAFKSENRSLLVAKPHLMILQFPPDLRVFQEIVKLSEASNVYIVGSLPGQFADVASFMKHLLGIIRFAVSKRDGRVGGEELAAALGTTKMAIALGLSTLRKLNVVDWYTEDGDIYLDLVGSPSGAMEEMTEFRQLSDSLTQIEAFRKWCKTAKLKEIQSAVIPNQIELISSNPDILLAAEQEEGFSNQPVVLGKEDTI